MHSLFELLPLQNASAAASEELLLVRCTAPSKLAAPEAVAVAGEEEESAGFAIDEGPALYRSATRGAPVDADLADFTAASAAPRRLQTRPTVQRRRRSLAQCTSSRCAKPKRVRPPAEDKQWAFG